jgi:hypothetical protein
MQKPKLQITGLYTDPNQWSSVPEGALATADNIIIDRPNIASSRRGFNAQVELTTPTKIFEYNGVAFVLDGSTLKRRDDATTFTSLSGTLTPISALDKVRSAVAGKSILFTSSEGIKVLDSTTGSIRLAGVPAALELSVATAVGVALPINSYFRYRVTFAKMLDNGRLIESAPSFSSILATAGATANGTIITSLPAGLDVSHTVRLYRSETSATNPPSEELYLAQERLITAGEIAAGFLTITDSTLEDNLGAFLYTNPSQGGIGNSYYPPPYAKDLFVYANSVFYCNTKSKYNSILTLTTQFTNGDTVTIDGTVFTAGAAENTGTGTFLNSTTNETTINSLVRCINRSALTIDARQLDGSVLIVERQTYAGATFVISTSVPTKLSFTPVSNNEVINGVTVSIFQQPESVPLNPPPYKVGQDDKAILRGLALQDAAFILKEDGFYSFFGSDYQSLSQVAIDSTYICVAPETAVVFDNRVWTLTNKGLVAANSNGVNEVSAPINNRLSEILNFDNLPELAFGVSYDTDYKYLLSVPINDVGTENKQVFVFNARSASWTRWTTQWKHALAIDNSNLLIAIRNDDYIVQERKGDGLNDYADDSFDNIITAVNGLYISFTTLDGLVVGNTIKQGVLTAKIIDINGTIATIDAVTAFTAATSDIYTPIQCLVEWVVDDSGNSGMLKHYQEATLIFEDALFTSVDFGTSSNFDEGREYVTLSVRSAYSWGNGPWGNFIWGGAVGGKQAIRTMISKRHRRAIWISLSVRLSNCFSSFDFNGLTYEAQGMTRRFR